MSEHNQVMLGKIREGLKQASGIEPTREILEKFIMYLTFNGKLNLSIQPEDLINEAKEFLSGGE